nr:hypothetical protein [uncultured Haemophilus sp.]
MGRGNTPFWCIYKKVNKNGSTTSIKNLLNHIKKLETLGLIISIIALIFSIYDSNQNQKDERILRIGDDFGEIATRNKKRIRCPSCDFGITLKEYQRVLEINYSLHSKFIINNLEYKDFEKFGILVKELNEDNQVIILEKLNTEIDKLYDKLVTDY